MRNTETRPGRRLSILHPSFAATRLILPVLATVLLAGGCATLQAPDRPATESMLTTAGFKMTLADTPAKLTALKARPQLKVIPIQRGGTLYYGYADAKGCGCAYLGDEAAYKKYQTFMVENRAIEEGEREPEGSLMPGTVIVVEDDDEWSAWGGGWY